jgi:hypothetical protein
MTKNEGRGIAYLHARAAADGVVHGALTYVGRWLTIGDCVNAEQAMRTVDDLVFRRDDDSKPLYTNADLRSVARDLYDSRGRR